jgi:hypothetical protein
MNRRLWGIAAYLLLVFASGIVVGGVGHYLYTAKDVSAGTTASRPKPEEFRRRFIKEMRDRLHLTLQQEAQLNDIMDDTRNNFREMRSRMRTETDAIEHHQIDRISSILNPDQQATYKKMVDEWNAKRKSRQQQGQGGHPHPGC